MKLLLSFLLLLPFATHAGAFSAEPYPFADRQPHWYQSGCVIYEDMDSIIVAIEPPVVAEDGVEWYSGKPVCDAAKWSHGRIYVKDEALTEEQAMARLFESVQKGVIDEQESLWLKRMVAAAGLDTGTTLFCVARGAAEANPLGLLVPIVKGIMVVSYRAKAKRTRRGSSYVHGPQQATALWAAASVWNLALCVR